MKLDINTNGAWRNVLTDLRPSDAEAVKAACVVISSAGSREGKVRNGPTWRLRDAFNQVFLHCGNGADAQWKVPPRSI